MKIIPAATPPILLTFCPARQRIHPRRARWSLGDGDECRAQPGVRGLTRVHTSTPVRFPRSSRAGGETMGAIERATQGVARLLDTAARLGQQWKPPGRYRGRGEPLRTATGAGASSGKGCLVALAPRGALPWSEPAINSGRRDARSACARTESCACRCTLASRSPRTASLREVAFEPASPRRERVIPGWQGKVAVEPGSRALHRQFQVGAAGLHRLSRVAAAAHGSPWFPEVCSAGRCPATGQCCASACPGSSRRRWRRYSSICRVSTAVASVREQGRLMSAPASL